MFWNRTPTTLAEDSYTSLPKAKNRRRSEPPTAVSLHSEGDMQQHRTLLQSIAPGNWATDGDRGVQPQERDRRVRLSPGMGRQRSRSAGENMHADSRRRASRFEPPYPGTREDREQEEEEEERSVRLQGVPVGTGVGMGRQRSRSAGDKTLQSPYPQHLRHPEIKYNHPGASAGVSTAEEGEEHSVRLQGRSGIGRQRSRSASENKLPPSHPHRQKYRSGLDWEAAGIQDEERQNLRLQGTGMGRQRSQSMGEGLHLHSRTPAHPSARTRPLALVGKNSRQNEPSSSSAHPPHPSPMPALESPVPLSPGKSQPRHHHQSPFQSQARPSPRPQPRPQPPMLRSILRTHSCASDRDASSTNDRSPEPFHVSPPPANRHEPSPAIHRMPLPRNQHVTLAQGNPSTSVQRAMNPVSPLPPSRSLSRIPQPNAQRHASELAHEQSSRSPIFRYVGHISSDTLWENKIRTGDGVRRNQPNTATVTHGIRNAHDEDKAQPNLPNPHPRLGEEYRDESEKGSVLLMPSDRLFDMERFSMLSVPSSSARPSPPPDPTASPTRSLASTYMQHHLSPGSHAERTSGLLRANGSEADLASVYSDSAPAVQERLMDISFPIDLESSAFFARVPDAKACTTPSRSDTGSSSTTSSSSGSSRPSSMSNTSASSHTSCLQHQHKQHQYIRALERELERCEVAVEDAIGETFRAREGEAALRWRVGELEVMLGASAGPGGGVGAGVDGRREVGGGVDRVDAKELREKFDVVVREKDEALRLLAEVKKVMYLVGATG